MVILFPILPSVLLLLSLWESIYRRFAYIFLVISDFLDCHLMVEHPERYIVPLKEAGANMFNFHIEAAGRFFF